MSCAVNKVDIGYMVDCSGLGTGFGSTHLFLFMAYLTMLSISQTIHHQMVVGLLNNELK